jgi:hypothetical protein
MRRLALFLPVLAVLAALIAGPGAARGASPCRDRIYNDWYRDGKIASTYPLACYRDAIKHIPNDARIYSSLDSDIRSALQAAIARSHGRKNVPTQVGTGLPVTSGGVKHANISLHATTVHAPTSAAPAANNGSAPQQAQQPQLSAAAPADSTSGGLPLPILVLGALALVLVAAGLLGAAARRFRR